MLLASSRCSNCSAFVVHIYKRILVGTFGTEFALLFAPNGNQQVLAGNLCAAFLTLDQASTTIHHSHTSLMADVLYHHVSIHLRNHSSNSPHSDSFY